jgi:chromosome segregation ATPase
VDDRTTLEHIETDVKTALLVQKLEFLEHRLDKLEQEKNEISRRLDKSEEERRETQAKLTALLTFQQEQPAKEQSVKKENKLWKKLFR